MADPRVLGCFGCSWRTAAAARVAHLLSTWWKRDQLDREYRYILPFTLLDFRAISLFLVSHHYNLIPLAQTAMQRPASPSSANCSNKGMDESAFLQVCKALLSFKYSSQGATLKFSRNSESTTKFFSTSTFLPHFPLHPAPKAWQTLGSSACSSCWGKEALAHHKEGDTEI